jgi:phosphatidylglycerophosphate synthase
MDGILARKYNMHTEFGAILDATVDVLSIVTTIFVLYLRYYYNNPLFLYILSSSLLMYLFITTIKVKNNGKSGIKLKSWERMLTYIPINLSYNTFLVHLFDPGLGYCIFMFSIYYTLFIKPAYL